MGEQTQLDDNEWVALVQGTIDRFIEETAPAAGFVDQSAPVAFVKEIHGLRLLRWMALNCPENRKQSFRKLIQSGFGTPNYEFIIKQMDLFLDGCSS